MQMNEDANLAIVSDVWMNLCALGIRLNILANVHVLRIKLVRAAQRDVDIQTWMRGGPEQKYFCRKVKAEITHEKQLQIPMTSLECGTSN